MVGVGDWPPLNPDRGTLITRGVDSVIIGQDAIVAPYLRKHPSRRKGIDENVSIHTGF